MQEKQKPQRFRLRLWKFWAQLSRPAAYSAKKMRHVKHQRTPFAINPRVSMLRASISSTCSSSR